MMCSSRKNPYPPHGRSSEIPKERGVLKAMYEAKLEFPEGIGVQNKKPSMGGSMDIFWNCTILPLGLILLIYRCQIVLFFLIKSTKLFYFCHVVVQTPLRKEGFFPTWKEQILTPGSLKRSRQEPQEVTLTDDSILFSLLYI